ncbi:hypothetical protein [Xanthobacter wiegelii]|uniref:hypothetical protein n=1 Tax=Xanthobacter wiegelii TaxID=3119913 RepID=UPI00372CBC61
MNMVAAPAAAHVRRTVSHIALNYRNPDEGPLAARLLEVLGFSVVQDIPLPDGSRFYQLLIDATVPTRAEGIVYMSALPAADRALYAAIREGLGVGRGHEHPAVASYRSAQASDPEYGFHVGILVESLEWIEDTMAKLKALAESDRQFKGRINLLCNRSRRGSPEVDARLDASPLFGTTPRETYGRNAVQAFVETDIFAAGALGEKLVFELDYVFPGYPDNMFTKTEL